MRPFALPLSLSIALLLAASSPSSAQFPTAPPPVRPVDDAPRAYQYIQEAIRNYQMVRDYSCMFVAHENLPGKKGEDQIIEMKFRQQPFSVYMKWARPKSMEGQEVAFVDGKNGNNLRVRNPGLLKVAGFMAIDLDDKRTLEHSRHTIREAGIGVLIDRTARSWQFDRETGKAVTQISAYKFDDKECYRIETTHLARLPQFYSYRGVIYLEKTSKLPIRTENYNWPVPGGNPGGDLLEVFSYTGIRWNTGLKDSDFDR